MRARFPTGGGEFTQDSAFTGPAHGATLGPQYRQLFLQRLHALDPTRIRIS